MQSNVLSRRPSHGMAILAGLSLFLVLVLPLSHPLTAPAAQSMPAGAGLAASGAAAGFMPALRQFTAGGHVVGFAPTQVVLAAFDHALRVEFVGTAGVAPVATDADAAASGDAPTLGRAQPLGVVTYADLWPGVSVEYRASEGSIVKSTYTVAPGADAGQIRLRYNVPVELQGDGSLRLSFGRGYISESAPLAWQEIAGQRVPIAVAFALVADADADASPVTRQAPLVTFRVGAHDARYPLTIDPNYVWHTFYGGAFSYDCGSSIAIDGSNNVYVTGESDTAWQGDGGANPLHAHSGGTDIVVVKLTSAGAYQWHTFYGSSSRDAGYGIAVDGSSNVYITGESRITWQGDGGANPIHAHSGGRYDIVVMKLTGAGVYQWHTFYGSTDTDGGFGIAVDGSSNVYITGYSNAAWQGDGGVEPLHAYSAEDDIVVVKLTSAGVYQWHTFYGSSYDVGFGIAVDGSSNVYITGWSEDTWQGDGGANPLHAYSGASDVVVIKLTSAGAYRWHTFYGSFLADRGNDIAVDGTGSIYITGDSDATWQGDGGANPLHPHSGVADLFALKLSSAGAYQWHTFYGSISDDSGYAIAVDGGNNVYITGYSEIAWQGNGGAEPLHAHSGNYDLFALKLTSAGAYQWHTFYGSTDADGGYGIAVGGSGSVYITGESYAAWQGDGDANPRHAYSGDADIVALKLSSSPTAVTLNFFTAQVAGGEVVLEWQTAAEVDVVGFDVYRAAGAAGPYSRITSALIPAQGDALSGASYRYVDAPGAGTFSYQLEAVHADGSSTRHGPVGVQVVPPRIFLPSLLRGR